MNLQTLLSTLRSFIQEDTAAFWSDTELKAYLNEADLRVLIEIQGGDIYRTTTSVSGQAAYDLPDFCIEINGVLYNNSSLYRISSDAFGLTNESGTPRNYFLPAHSNKLYLDPVPSSTGDVIKLVGRFKSADMSGNTDVPETPNTLHMAIVYWAAMLAWQKRKDTEQASNMFRLYRLVIDNWDGPVDAGPLIGSSSKS